MMTASSLEGVVCAVALAAAWAGGPSAGDPTLVAALEPIAGAMELTSDQDRSEVAGLFLSRRDLDRARQRIGSEEQPFAASYRDQRARALRYLTATADPFHMRDMSGIVYAWDGDRTRNTDDSLREAVDKFEIGSDQIRTLALEYALTGDTRFADKAVEMMLDWARQHTPVNVYDFDPDFEAGTIAGMTSGAASERPWNFALDTMWQSFGLTNASDAYLLLVRNGYVLRAEDDFALQDWIRLVAEAVNSSFHAWTRWADAHPDSPSHVRYRSDNHLTWCHVGLLSAAVALGDTELREYVVKGGSWSDSRSGPYENPSFVYDVIDRAIESGTGRENEGRIYEELILRTPSIEYSLFHLQAMQLVARIAQIHSSEDIWSFRGSDNGGIELAFDRYAAFLLGERRSPQQDEPPSATYLYELAYSRWPRTRFADVIGTTDRLYYSRHGIGPVVLLLGESGTALSAAEPAPAPEGPDPVAMSGVEPAVRPPDSRVAGLFLSRQDLDRARRRMAGSEQPFAASYRNQRTRAMRNLTATADPFRMEDMSTIVFAWGGDRTNDVDDSLRDAVDKFDTGSDQFRTLALEYALTGDTRFGDKAVEMMLVWARQHTPVNVYDLNPDFRASTIDGMTEGYSSERPWNFALDAMWQTYGLTNTSDAYLLLTRNGYALSSEDDTALRDWIRRVAEAVNSSFHAWTRWADLRPRSPSFVRYRSDNHLSWCHVGLLSAAAALGDEELQDYVLNGGSWTDSRSGPYENPSHVYDVIDRAIESGTGSENEGRVYEELILRTPAVGYSLFHLQAMQLVARIAQVHYSDEVWNFRGSDNGGIELAFDRYAAFILGERQSPQQDEQPRATYLYELVYAQWPKPRFADVINTTDRMYYSRQAIGPVVLLVGEVIQ